MGSNEDQKAFWSGKAGESWVKDKLEMDQMLFQFGEKVLEDLSLRTGENVLDVGCGTGSTSEFISTLVGEGGTVLGVDLSKPMLASARLSAESKGINNINFVQMDVQTEMLPYNYFHSVFSRFGVMFFNDPFYAFKNIYRSMISKGKIGFICWAKPEDNPWYFLTHSVIKKYFDISEISERRAPSPFAFQEQSYIYEILDKAGFKNISISLYENKMTWFKGRSLDNIVMAMITRNPLYLENFNNTSKRARRNLLEDLVIAYTAFYSNNRLCFPSSAWQVSAYS